MHDGNVADKIPCMVTKKQTKGDPKMPQVLEEKERELRPATVRLPLSLLKDLQKLAIDKDVSFQTLITEALTEWYEAHEEGSKP